MLVGTSGVDRNIWQGPRDTHNYKQQQQQPCLLVHHINTARVEMCIRGVLQYQEKQIAGMLSW
ncbi:hypothetical protein E2C01_040868 [Portunus trituberculatus]|uniref:Uncharacterized protein n=1 Tax=Portunus trituberculatus TaxID=210409 RepID=A0A5B7FPX5_PORTR|nr:hypothetical protein [Portunus trituberculatus]